MGDITGDSLVYLLGRFGVPPFIKRITIRFGVMHEKIQSVHAYFDANPAKTISLSKITLGVGFAGIYLAGYAKIPYNKFIRICLIISALQYVVYLSIGVLFGSAYKQISQYMDYFTALIIILTMSILLFVLIRLKRNKI